MWLGYGFNRNMAHFINPNYEDYANDADHKEGMIRVSGVVWFTNVEIKKRHEDLILYKTYYGNELEYPKYENYDAINVDKVKDIPLDFDGQIWVYRLHSLINIILTNLKLLLWVSLAQ